MTEASSACLSVAPDRLNLMLSTTVLYTPIFFLQFCGELSEVLAVMDYGWGTIVIGEGSHQPCRMSMRTEHKYGDWPFFFRLSCT